jgi:hypothetical protein
LKEEKFEMSVLNSLNGAQVESYVDNGYCARIIEDNLEQTVNAFLGKSIGTDDIIASEDLQINVNSDSDSVSINVDADYAYMLESDSYTDNSDEEIMEDTSIIKYSL